MEHTAEITEELFYMLVTQDTKVHEVKSRTSYTDIVYIIENTRLFRRTQNNIANYYIVDINS